MVVKSMNSLIGSVHVTRRTFLGLSATAVASLLAACGGEPDESTTASTSESESPSTTTSNSGSASPSASGGTPASSSATPSVSAVQTTTSTEGGTPKKGGTLVIADPQGGATLDPFKTTWHSTAHFLVFTSFVDTAPDLTYIPYTFESWEVSPDGKEVTFKIDPAITFSDGTPVTADGIKYIVEREIDPDLHSPGASAFGPLTSVEVVDDKTCKFIYETPYAPLFNGLSGREVSSAEAVKKAGDDFGNHPVGAGPFLVKEIISGNVIKYTRNEDYKWPPKYYKNRGPSYFDGVNMRVITEDATIWAALQSGEVHIGPVASTYVKDAKNAKNLDVLQQLDNGIRYLGMNCSKPPFDNELVRQAVSHAVNRQVIVDNALDGYGKVLYSPLAFNIPFCDNEGMKKISYDYDVAAAKDKLKQAGYDVSGDIATKDGKPFEAELMVPNDDFFKRAAQILQGQLKEAGIKININVMDSSAMNEATTTGNHQMFITLYGQTDPSILFYFFSSTRVKATNRAWYFTDELDALLNQAMATLDPEKAKPLWEQIQTMIVKASPWVVLCDPYTFTGVSKKLHGFKLHPQGEYMLHDAWLES
ncbi:MAG TPA: ABC transporter substrate-binding protein [Nitrolancea sp.]|nr:ABC transporter substrate-binding protein [Nitrolancea sp.]